MEQKTWKDRRARRLQVGAAIAAIALVLGACGDARDQPSDDRVRSDDDLAADDPGENKGEYQDIYTNPSRYRDETVTVSGIVMEVHGDRWFRLTTAETPESSLLVLHPGGKDIAPRLRMRVIGVMTQVSDADVSPPAGANDAYAIVVDDITQISGAPYNGTTRDRHEHEFE